LKPTAQDRVHKPQLTANPSQINALDAILFC